MRRDPKNPPKKQPMLVSVYALAQEHRVLPWAIKQLPWSELQEMIEMHNLRGMQ